MRLDSLGLPLGTWQSGRSWETRIPALACSQEGVGAPWLYSVRGLLFWVVCLFVVKLWAHSSRVRVAWKIWTNSWTLLHSISKDDEQVRTDAKSNNKIKCEIVALHKCTKTDRSMNKFDMDMDCFKKLRVQYLDGLRVAALINLQIRSIDTSNVGSSNHNKQHFMHNS